MAQQEGLRSLLMGEDGCGPNCLVTRESLGFLAYSRAWGFLGGKKIQKVCSVVPCVPGTLGTGKGETGNKMPAVHKQWGPPTAWPRPF